VSREGMLHHWMRCGSHPSQQTSGFWSLQVAIDITPNSLEARWTGDNGIQDVTEANEGTSTGSLQ